MSLQQVNLYQDELRKQKLNYSASMLAKLSVVLLVVFLIFTGFRSFQLQQLQQTLTVLQQEQKTTMAELQKAQTALLKRKNDNALAKQITEKTTELASKQKVLGILSQDEFGNTKGFAEYVSGLARQRIDGLWLTHLRFSSGGTDVALHGSTSKPSLLPKYLQRLSAEKAFSGTQFQSLLMARQEKKNQWLNFSLQNKKADEVKQ